MNAKILWHTEVDKKKTDIGFGCIDGKGREIGAVVFTSAVDIVDAESDYRCFYNSANITEPGTYYRVFIYNTRAGKKFGGACSSRFFRTECLRDEYISSRLGNMRKRAEK